MLKNSSRTLVWMIGGRIEVQLLLISPEFEFTIVEFKLAYALNRHELLWIYVQSCSMMLPDDESSKGNAIYVKKFQKVLRENL
jgi:hypothetical protein